MTCLPRHIAIVMDGNGRWAERRHLPRIAGHKAGVTAVRRSVEASAKLGIEVLTLFAFSSENWRRPAKEVDFLMQLLSKTLRSELKELHENNIRLRIIGDRSGLNLKLRQAIFDAEQLTASNSGLTLVIALNYGGIWDVLQATQALVAKEIAPQDINAEQLYAHLSTKDLPLPDLFIRTSGEQRLSNFMLLQAAYAELYFTDVLWPDFSELDLELALHDFAKRQRRYGRVSKPAKEVNSA